METKRCQATSTTSPFNPILARWGDRIWLSSEQSKTAYATIKGFEVMRMFKKGQFRLWIETVGGRTKMSRNDNRDGTGTVEFTKVHGVTLQRQSGRPGS